MNLIDPVNAILYAMAITTIVLIITFILVIVILIAEWMGCNIPDWMKKLKK